MKHRKEIIGHKYSCEGRGWSVETDYPNGRVYVTAPPDDEDDDIESIEAFGKAVIRAVEDYKKKVI